MTGVFENPVNSKFWTCLNHPCYHGNDPNLTFNLTNVISYKYRLFVPNLSLTPPYTQTVFSNLRMMWQFWNITSAIFAKCHVQIMLLFVYTTTRKRFVIFTCRYFKLSWNTTALSQSNCRNFSRSSIINKILADHRETAAFTFFYHRLIYITIICPDNIKLKFDRQYWKNLNS